MDKTNAQRLVRETFKAAFDKKRYRGGGGRLGNCDFYKVYQANRRKYHPLHANRAGYP